MKNNASFIIGICAGIICASSFFPQVVKILRTKSAKDISLVTFVMFFLGVFLWLIYGILIEELPIILANSITLILAFFIIAMKIKYR